MHCDQNTNDNVDDDRTGTGDSSGSGEGTVTGTGAEAASKAPLREVTAPVPAPSPTPVPAPSPPKATADKPLDSRDTSNTEDIADDPQARIRANQFKPGHSGNPGGRPRGSVTGLKKARQLIDQLLKKPANMKMLVKALQEEFDSMGALPFVNKYCDLKTLTRDTTRPSDDGVIAVDEMPRAIVIKLKDE